MEEMKHYVQYSIKVIAIVAPFKVNVLYDQQIVTTS